MIYYEVLWHLTFAMICYEITDILWLCYEVLWHLWDLRFAMDTIPVLQMSIGLAVSRGHRAPDSWPLNTPLQTVTRPVSVVCFLCLGLGSDLVRMSVVWSASLTSSGVIILSFTNCFTECHLRSICHELVVIYGFVVRAITPRLLLWIVRASVIGDLSSINKFQNQCASVPAYAKATVTNYVRPSCTWPWECTRDRGKPCDLPTLRMARDHGN